MDDDDKPILRRTIRGHLAERPTVSLSHVTLHSRYEREFGGELKDYEAACLFLVSLGAAEEVKDPMGGREKFYRITAKGIIAHERGD